MEHRETPRMVTAEGRPRDARAEPLADGPRFARFVAMPRERRLVLSRLALAVPASVLALIAVGSVGSLVCERLVRWLHDRPQYQTTFGAIVLDPPPPGWYRGGRPVFLDRVRQAALREDVPFSALDVELKELYREFRLYCWVKRVGQIRGKFPNVIIVPLEYRTPVAWASVPGEPARVLLDEDGVILPVEDMDEEKGGPLIPILELDPPFEQGPGRVWKSKRATEGSERANEGVLAAAKLASFLVSVLTDDSRPIPRALIPNSILVTRWEGEEKSFIFLETAEKTLIYWAEPPGLETPGRPTAAQRWADLHEWIKRRPAAPVLRPHYLDFDKDGVVIRRRTGEPGG